MLLILITTIMKVVAVINTNNTGKRTENLSYQVLNSKRILYNILWEENVRKVFLIISSPI